MWKLCVVRIVLEQEKGVGWVVGSLCAARVLQNKQQEKNRGENKANADVSSLSQFNHSADSGQF